MRRIFVLCLLLVLCTSPALAGNSADRPSSMGEKAFEKTKGNPHEMIDLIVTYHARPNSAARARVERAGGTVRRSFELIPGHAIRVPAHAAVALAKNPNVAYVTVDAPVSALAVEGAQGATELYPEAANLAYTGQGVGIAVVDSGYKNHSDLSQSVAATFSLVGNKADDQYGHGNHVIGMIAGNGSGSGYYKGLAPDATIYAVRALNDMGEGLTSDVIGGLDWAIQMMLTLDIRIVNISLGHPVYELAAQDPLVQAVEAVWDAGIVVVCSAGNSGQNGFGTVTSPGNSSRVITVGSVSHYSDGDAYNDIVSTYSSRGPTAGDHFVKPDLLAPGNKVIATEASRGHLMKTYPERLITAPGDKGSDYFSMSGTSMSAGMVTGAVALMLEKEPGLNPDTVKARLMRSARKADMGSPFSTGAGVLDVAAALDETGYTDFAGSPKAYREGANASATIVDGFTGVTYANNDGSQMWSGPWIEANDDGSPSAGNVRIENSRLFMDNKDGGSLESISRSADLSGATSATLSFVLDSFGEGGLDKVAIEVSDDGGASFAALEVMEIVGSPGGLRSYDLGSSVTLNDQFVLRFRIVQGLAATTQYIGFDQVQLAVSSHDGSGVIGFDNTGVTWGGAEWSQAILWSDGIIWGDAVIWGDGYIWSDAVIWSDGLLWSDGIIWGDAIVWGDSIVWGDAIVWGDGIVWGDSTMTRNMAEAQGAIWGD